MDEQRYYIDEVGDEMYQLQLVVEEKTPEEIPHRGVEAMLEERREDDLLLHTSVGNSSPTTAFHSTSAFGLSSARSTSDWIFTSVIIDGTHIVLGPRIRRVAAAIP
jgi:hypothetical protein